MHSSIIIRKTITIFNSIKEQHNDQKVAYKMAATKALTGFRQEVTTFAVAEIAQEAQATNYAI